MMICKGVQYKGVVKMRERSIDRCLCMDVAWPGRFVQVYYCLRCLSVGVWH